MKKKYLRMLDTVAFEMIQEAKGFKLPTPLAMLSVVQKKPFTSKAMAVRKELTAKHADSCKCAAEHHTVCKHCDNPILESCAINAWINTEGFWFCGELCFHDYHSETLRLKAALQTTS